MPPLMQSLAIERLLRGHPKIRLPALPDKALTHRPATARRSCSAPSSIGRIGSTDAIACVVAQVIGAVAASATVLVAAGQDAVLGTRNLPGGGVCEVAAFFVEVVLTAIFLLVILTVTKRSPSQAQFAISLTLAVIHFAGIPFGGASVNPARSLGPALVGADLTSIWIYLTAPFVGAAVGWALFRYLGSGTDAG